MRTLNQWAKRWNIPLEAVADLTRVIGIAASTPQIHTTDVSETALLQQIMLAAPKYNMRLFRNNSGATYTPSGRLIRYGLGNTSAVITKNFKSSDLIGVTKYKIQQHDVGQHMGIFTSIEVKKPGWKYTGVPREKAQLKWLQLILSFGGIAKFITNVKDL